MKILDVGGAENTLPEATHVIDIRPCAPGRACVLRDICDTAWPYADKEFDFVFCSNVLEDIKDPVRVCREMERVGKAGVIIVPSLYLECAIGVDGWPGKETYAGYYHHRWLWFPGDGKLTCCMKTPIVSVFDWLAHATDEEKKNHYIQYQWIDKIGIEEIVYSDWNTLCKMLADFFRVVPERRRI